MKKLLVSLLVVLVVLGLGASVKAQQVQPRGDFDLIWLLRPPTQAEVDNLAQRLQLTQSQRNEMQRNYTRLSGDINQLFTRYQNARQNLVIALQQPTPVPGRVEDALRQLDGVHSNLLQKEMQLWNSLSNNLSQQQTQEFWRLFGADRLPYSQREAPQPYPYRPY
jgi:hypothetical protein